MLTLALQSAVPPFATDMYTPALPRVTADLATSASLVGLTLTTFFLGIALGQPPGISRWLAWDLPHRVQARTEVPLTVISSRSCAGERSRPRNAARTMP